MGTAWQRALHGRVAALPIAWLVSTVRGLVHPGNQLRRAIIVPEGARSLLWINVCLASGLLTWQSARTTASIIVQYWPSAVPSPPLALGPTWPLAATLVVFGMWVTLVRFLVGVERFGIHFYSARRSWRIGRVLSLIGTAHASGAWIVAAVGARLVPSSVETLIRVLPPSLAVHLSGVAVLAPALGFIAGMIWFEIATYFGLRACRYGNHPGVRRPGA